MMAIDKKYDDKRLPVMIGKRFYSDTDTIPSVPIKFLQKWYFAR